MIAPLKFCSDFRPYFTIHDSEFKEYTTRTQAPWVHLNATLNNLRWRKSCMTKISRTKYLSLYICIGLLSSLEWPIHFLPKHCNIGHTLFELVKWDLQVSKEPLLLHCCFRWYCNPHRFYSFHQKIPNFPSIIKPLVWNRVTPFWFCPHLKLLFFMQVYKNKWNWKLFKIHEEENQK